MLRAGIYAVGKIILQDISLDNGAREKKSGCAHTDEPMGLADAEDSRCPSVS